MVVRFSVERTRGALQETCDREKQKAIQREEILAHTGRSTAEKSVINLCEPVREMMPVVKAALPDRVTISVEASSGEAAVALAQPQSDFATILVDDNDGWDEWT